MPDTNFKRLNISRRGIFLRIRDTVYALKGPRSGALYSERTRSGVRVFPLAFGWRITVRDVARLQSEHRNPFPVGGHPTLNSIMYDIERWESFHE